MNVIAYHEPIPGPQFDNEKELVSLFKENWSRNGWTPMVFGIEDYNEGRWGWWMDLMSKLPTVNPSQYQAAVWRRWCVFADKASEACGGGRALLVDYDTLNIRVTPELLRSDAGLVSYGNNELIWALLVNPGALMLMPYIIKAVAPRCIHCEPEGEHTSDMWVLERLCRDGFVQRACSLQIPYHEAAAQSFCMRTCVPGLVHLANSIMIQRGTTSLEAWKRLTARS